MSRKMRTRIPSVYGAIPFRQTGVPPGKQSSAPLEPSEGTFPPPIWHQHVSPPRVPDPRQQQTGPYEIDMSPPEVDMGLPEVDMSLSEVDMGFPEVDMGFPKADMPIPEVDTYVPEVKPDPYVNSRLVAGLDKCTFCPFIKKPDATFIMFYDPCELMSGLAKLHIRGAASRTVRANHKYAAVDCTAERELCAIHQFQELPAYQLYSRGNLVGTYDMSSMRAKDIQRFVETCPVSEVIRPAS